VPVGWSWVEGSLCRCCPGGVTDTVTVVVAVVVVVVMGFWEAWGAKKGKGQLCDEDECMTTQKAM